MHTSYTKNKGGHTETHFGSGVGHQYYATAMDYDHHLWASESSGVILLMA